MGCMSSKNLPPVDTDILEENRDNSQKTEKVTSAKPTQQQQSSGMNDAGGSSEPILIDQKIFHADVEQEDFRLTERSSDAKIITPAHKRDENGVLISEETSAHVYKNKRPATLAEDAEHHQHGGSNNGLPEGYDDQTLPTQSELEMDFLFRESEDEVLAKTRSGRIGSIVVSHEGTDGIHGRMLFKSIADEEKPEMRTKGSMARIVVVNI